MITEELIDFFKERGMIVHDIQVSLNEIITSGPYLMHDGGSMNNAVLPPCEETLTFTILVKRKY